MRKVIGRLPNGRLLTENINPLEDDLSTNIGTTVNTLSKVKQESGVKSSTADDALEVGKTAAAGAAIGATVGSAVPVIGTAVGGAVGAVLGATIKTAEILFSGKGGKQTRLDREEKRRKIDQGRIKTYKNYNNPKKAYEDYIKGKIVFTMGTPGSQKEHETGSFRFENGTIVEKDKDWIFKYFGNSKGHAKAHKDKLYLGSIVESANILKTVKKGEDIWARQAKKSIPKAEIDKAISNISKKVKSLAADSKKNKISKKNNFSSLSKLAVKTDTKIKTLESKLKDSEKDKKKIISAGNKAVTSLEINNKNLVSRQNKLKAALGLPKSYV